jgi:hypothetical protein
MVFLLSMIVNNLCVVWAVVPPFEANAPLLVYQDTLLAAPVFPQSFKPITAKIHQIFEAGGAVEYLQAPLSLLHNSLKTGRSPATVELFGVPTSK